VFQKGTTALLAIIFSNLNRFSKFFFIAKSLLASFFGTSVHESMADFLIFVWQQVLLTL